MVAVVEVDLGALGVRLPRGEVAMVIAQPHVDPLVDFVQQEPFTWTDASRQRALEAIDATLAVSLKSPHSADKTHFTVFPECTLPGLEGVDRITAAMQADEWPRETVVIGGVDGLGYPREVLSEHLLCAFDAGRMSNMHSPGISAMNSLCTDRRNINEDTYEVSPAECDVLRAGLYHRGMSDNGRSELAKRFLASLECRRREGGRPNEERRHPDPSDGREWMEVFL